MRVANVTFLGTLLFAAACTTGRRGEIRWTIPPSAADSVSTQQLAPGVQLHRIVRARGPLRAFVLDIDLQSCVSIRAAKGAPTAVGRATTSALLSSFPDDARALAAVNADFFLFAPPGVPVGALVVDGQLLSGPVARPVLAFDAQQRPFIGTLSVVATFTSARGRIDVATWNRPSATAIGVVDAAWGQPLDSLARPGALQLIPIGTATSQRFIVEALPSTHSGLARGDTMMLVGSARASVLPGDTVRVTRTLQPITPAQAVGAFPLLLRDSMIVSNIDSAGAASFRGVNPRTAAGYAANGRRLFLVVIDGRQAGYSAGTTTRETAELLRDLGAREAVNLDGGGSSAMVVRDLITGKVSVVNKPSDATGERPVANALVVTNRCGR